MVPHEEHPLDIIVDVWHKEVASSSGDYGECLGMAYRAHCLRQATGEARCFLAEGYARDLAVMTFWDEDMCHLYAWFLATACASDHTHVPAGEGDSDDALHAALGAWSTCPMRSTTACSEVSTTCTPSRPDWSLSSAQGGGASPKQDALPSPLSPSGW